MQVDDDDVVTLIDFPQMISVTHFNATELFERDVDCVIRWDSQRPRVLYGRPCPPITQKNERDKAHITQRGPPPQGALAIFKGFRSCRPQLCQPTIPPACPLAILRMKERSLAAFGLMAAAGRGFRLTDVIRSRCSAGSSRRS